MGTQRTPIGRVVVVKTHRKEGNGAKGGGRKGNTGKKGIIYDLAPDGSYVEPPLAERKGGTFTELKKELRSTRLIPPHVALNKCGETVF